MSGSEAKAIVRRFFDEAWNQKKVSELDDYISANNIHRGLSADGAYGPDHIRRVMQNWHTAFPDFQYQIDLPIRLEQVAQLPREAVGCAWPHLAGCRP